MLESTIKHWQPREGTKEEDPEKIRGLMQQRHAFWGVLDEAKHWICSS
jgi:hypothetical protein